MVVFVIEFEVEDVDVDVVEVDDDGVLSSVISITVGG